ncbi:hypothetical protein [Natronogracilivirga saccharolytica]|uniref:Uncharacterized protein n=1 Tax=Natronogracilivirga saccharolytica TaxID=2812953 RepID=A0A8J7UY20_9BACT|nr:hypothetical protein [Natronogracilivirga saccharolytica]MBP3193959.1 hypothetical protein [Natronogracilivirga saccharolytica]
MNLFDHIFFVSPEPTNVEIAPDLTRFFPANRQYVAAGFPAMASVPCQAVGEKPLIAIFTNAIIIGFAEGKQSDHGFGNVDIGNATGFSKHGGLKFLTQHFQQMEILRYGNTQTTHPL